MKVCACCGRELPETMFHKCAKARDGYQSYCKDCKNKKREEKNARKEDDKLLDAPAGTGSELSRFSSRDLISELRKRGVSGELSYIKKVLV